MSSISKWELYGVPAAIVFEAVHRLGVFDHVGITAGQLPDLMVVVFVLAAFIRGKTQAGGGNNGGSKS